MSHPDPQHDPENVRIEDAPYSPTNSPTLPCRDCDGRGEFTYPPSLDWYSGQTDDCPTCDGTGRSPNDDQE
jgi:DnaJ-class molecular chaperone